GRCKPVRKPGAEHAFGRRDAARARDADDLSRQGGLRRAAAGGRRLTSDSNPAVLVLEDGTVFEGLAFGAKVEAIGEVVFTTGMTGYQETLTDPSFKGQMVVLTYPIAGNYGINPDDVESRELQLNALIVHDLCEEPSNWRSNRTLDKHLKLAGIPGIKGVDTRALTRHIRQAGAMRGSLSSTRSPDA